MNGLAYWVGIQLVLDLGLLALVLFLLFKIRGLKGLLKASHPEPVVRLDGAVLSDESAGLGEGRRSGTGQKPTTWFSGFPHPSAPSEPRAFEPFPSSRTESGKSLRAQVENLASQGLSPEDIARRLNLNLAEVKIALDLSRLLSK